MTNYPAEEVYSLQYYLYTSFSLPCVYYVWLKVLTSILTCATFPTHVLPY